MSSEESTAASKASKSFKDRKTFWYTVDEISEEGTCPSCGRSMDKFKNVTAHVKRCFSIKKIGPIYRLHGYVECKCGLLIADNTKAKKLHLCTGEVPAFEPELNYEQLKPSPALSLSIDQGSTANRLTASSPCLEEKKQLPKPWIRNFVSPFKLDVENMPENTKPEPRVRNFDMPSNRLEPQNVSVYSISSNNGAIFVTGQSPKSGKKSVILIQRPKLRLPRLKGSKYS
ncbi:uncharacterized protein LOC133843824 [Drosophila sulfurigaster albostrigata]|uniref:uncharacterized protein LOC133843824 n=1 Tax=Drosophila sulfurigaster albostrigata TaxID=89887 RepID=UPI002D218C35|nr:uncharacterized protein LOC133843824 [Drosophila sulfurigaster albostrigata]